jgi:hypothetical protein
MKDNDTSQINLCFNVLISLSIGILLVKIILKKDCFLLKIHNLN